MTTPTIAFGIMHDGLPGQFTRCPNPMYLTGPICKRCSGSNTLYYAKTHKCVECQSRAARKWRDKKADKAA